MGSNGLSTTSATVTLPPELGGITAQIGGVSIGAEGLSFSGGNMTIPLPDIPFGDMMSLTGNVAELKIVGTDAGQTYMLDVNSTLNMNVAGETKQETVNFTMSLAPDGTFEMAGNISGLALDLGVATLGLQDVAMTTSGLTAAEAAITIPALGGATAAVSDVGVGADGLSIGGGIFTFPELCLADGNVILSGIQAQLVPVDGAWTMAGQGTVQVSTGPDRPASDHHLQGRQRWQRAGQREATSWLTWAWPSSRWAR